eukprot:4173599-Alexandrium_andersonii.AAC.1
MPAGRLECILQPLPFELAPADHLGLWRQSLLQLRNGSLGALELAERLDGRLRVLGRWVLGLR